MHLTMLALRFLHIVLGAFWVGAIFFLVLFLEPSVRAAGPDGAKVTRALQDRGFMKIMPVVALVTILTGLDLYRRLSGGFVFSWMTSPIGLTYTVGAAAAVIALLLGFFVMRAAMVKAGRLAATLEQVPAGEHSRVAAEVERMRLRSRATARVVALLLLVATGAMAIAPYM